MTLLTGQRVTGILCSFSLVPEEKKQIKRYLNHHDQKSQKRFQQKLSPIRYRRQHLRPSKWKRYIRFTFVENNISKFTNTQSFCKVINSFALLAQASLTVSRNLLQQSLTCMKFPFSFSLHSVDTNQISCFNQQYRQLKAKYE